MKRKPAKPIILGDKYSKLTVISITGKRYLCQCTCGKKREFVAAHLTNKHNTSCGSKKCDTTRTHGLVRTRFYRKWDGLNKRCTREKTDGYYRYGGRGIKSHWIGNFQKFKDDMYDSYLEHFQKHGNDTQIDRIDVNGNYCKENCRWVTMSEQANNRSTNRFVVYKGERMTITQLCRKLGIYRTKIFNLLKSRTMEDVFKLIDNGKIYKKSTRIRLESL